MAKNEVVFKIRMDGDKLVVSAADKTKKLRDEVDRTSKSYSGLNKTIQSHTTTQNKGVLGTANNARNFSKLSQTIGSGDNGLVGAYAALAANTFAVSAAFLALSKASGANKIIAGLEAQGARLGRTLSITAEEIRNITGATLSMAENMRATAQLTAAGFDTQQISRLSAVAKDAAGALGRDVGDAVDRLTRGVSKLEPELLDEIGIMVKLDEASRKYAIANQKTTDSLTSVEKRQAFVNAVLEEGERKFGGIGSKLEEYDAFTRLAAAGTDAFNSVIGVLAEVLATIAELFASNKLFVVSAVLLYASTIRGQLVPALGEAARKQAELASLQKAQLAERAKDFAGQVSDLDSSVDRGKDGKFLPGTGSKSLKKLSAELIDQTANTRSFQIATDSLNDSLIKNELALKRVTNEYDRQNIEANIELINDQKNQVERLNRAYLQQVAAERAVNTMQIAQNTTLSNLIPNIKRISASFGEQFAILQNSRTVMSGTEGAIGTLTAKSQNLATTLGNVGSIAGTGFKAFGTIFLNLLPVIGQVTFAISLLSTAWSFMKDLLTTDAQKKYNEILEDFNTILESSAEKTQEFNRLMGSTTNIARSQADALVILGNSVSELTSAYLKLRNQAKVLEEKSFFDEWILDLRLFRSEFDEIDKMISNAESDRGFFGFFDKGSTEEYASGLRLVKSQISILPPALQQVVREQLRVADSAGTTEAKLSGLDKIINGLDKGYKNLAPTVEGAVENFNNLETEVSKFATSARISTPVDGMRESLTKANESVELLSAKLREGTITSEQFGNTLQNIGEQSKGLVGSVEGLSLLGRVNDQIISLEAKGESITKQEKELLETRRGQARELASRIGPEMQKQLIAAEQLTRQAQEDHRLLKSRIDLEKTRFKAISDILDTGAAGFLAREAHEERVRSLQARQLDVQIALLKTQQNRQQAQLEELKVRQFLTQLGLTELELSKAISKELRDRQLGVRTKGGKGVTDFNEDLAEISASIKTAEANLTNLGDSIKSLDDQKAAILAENLTAAEKAAEAFAANLRVSQEFIKQLIQFSDIVADANIEVERYNRLVRGQRNDLDNTIESLVKGYDKTIKKAQEELQTKESQLISEENIIKARLASRTLSAEDRTAGEFKLKVVQDTLSNEVAIFEAMVNQAAITLDLKILESALIDNRNEGIQIQEKALGFLEKEVSLRQKNSDLQSGIVSKNRETSRILSGLPETDQSKKNADVIAATEALRSVKAAAQIRLAAIDAEYALLEAQKTLLQTELLSKRELLRAAGVSEDFLSGISNAIGLLDRIDTNAMAEIAKKGVRLEIEAASAEVINAVAKANTREIFTSDNFITRFLSNQVDNKEKTSVTEEAIKALKEPIDNLGVKIVKATNETGLAQLDKLDSKTLTPTFIKTTQIADHVTGSSSGNLDINKAGRELQASGLRVSEQKGFGGITPGIHSGSGHDQGRAIDVSLSKGIIEADVPHLKARFDKLAQEYASRGYIVLWNKKRYSSAGISSAAGHEDHMHIETPALRVAPTPGPVAAEVETRSTNDAAERFRGFETPERISTSFDGPSESLVSSLPNFTSQELPDIEGKLSSSSQSLLKFKEDFETSIEPLRKLATDLGPDGELVLALTQGVSVMTQSISTSFKAIEENGIGSTQGIAAVLSTVSSAISTISSLLAAASQAKIRGIEAEIAAEQKRDGQSVASQKKLEELEKKKEQVARKQFNVNKKLMMAQAVIGTAAGIAMALGSAPPPMSFILAGIIGAMGAAQLAVIAGTSYQGGNSSSAGKVNIPKLQVGRVGDKVNLDKSNANAGGEIGFLRGSQGIGSNSSNFNVIGSASGGATLRGYGQRSFLVGERGPEYVETNEPMNVKPARKSEMPSGDTYVINATDAESFESMLKNNPGAIAEGLKKLANSSGQTFMENVDLKSFQAKKR